MLNKEEIAIHVDHVVSRAALVFAQDAVGHVIVRAFDSSDGLLQTLPCILILQKTLEEHRHIETEFAPPIRTVPLLGLSALATPEPMMAE